MKKSLRILEPYIPDLERIVAALNEAAEDESTSVERILEETMSELVYDYRKLLDLAGRLPVVYMNGTRYYRDDRLREFRNVEDFSDRILFEDYKRKALPEAGGCMYDHDHIAHPEQGEWHD